MIIGEHILDDTAAESVVTPASPAEAGELLAEQIALGLAVVPWGSGSGVHQGNLLSNLRWAAMSTAGLNQIYEYSAADMVITVGAGTPLATIQQAVAQHGQWLPFDLPGQCTLGGIVARNAFGAMRLQFGLPRDRLLAVEALLYDGTIIKSGARVVKNVAGYDLCKLFAGSYGTLGLMLNLTFKTAPITASKLTLVFPAETLAAAVRCGMEIHARHLAPAGLMCAANPCALTVHLLGGLHSVQWQQQQVTNVALTHKMGEPRAVPDSDAWPLVGDPAAAVSARMVTLPSAQADSLEQIASILPIPPTGMVCLPGLGITNLEWGLVFGTPDIVVADRLLRNQLRPGESLAWVRVPRSAKQALGCVWGLNQSQSALHSGIKHALDPRGVFAPGRFAGGI